MRRSSVSEYAEGFGTWKYVAGRQGTMALGRYAQGGGPSGV